MPGMIRLYCAPLPTRPAGKERYAADRRLSARYLCRALTDFLSAPEPVREEEIARPAGGKPYYLPSPENPCFSVSHSGAFWMAAVDTAPVGLDIQHRRTTYPVRVAARMLHPAEQAVLRDAKNPARCFFDLWTAKEALAKYTGEGMRMDFAAWNTLPLLGVSLFSGEMLPAFDIGYSLTLASARGRAALPEEIVYLPPETADAALGNT